MPKAAAAQDDVMLTEYELVPGAWYAAAANTSPLPAYLAVEPLKETLGAPEHKFGHLEIFTAAADLPADVGPAVRNAKNADGPANIWALGQFTPPGWDGTSKTPVRVALDPHVIVIEKLRRGEPGQAAPPAKKDTPASSTAITKPSEGVSTKTLVLATVAIGTVSLAGVALVWYVTKKKKRKNGRRRKRK